MLIYHVPLQYFRTNNLHNRCKMCQPCHPVGSIMVNLVWFTRKESHPKYVHNHNTETETPNNPMYIYIVIVCISLYFDLTPFQIYSTFTHKHP